MTSKGLAVIAGVGPGLGASLSRRFAKEYKVVLLARSQGTLDTISESINKDGGESIGLPTDCLDEASMTKTAEEIKKLGIPVVAAVFNLGGGDLKYFRSPFLNIPVSAFQSHWESQVKAAFIFSQAVIPLLLSTASTTTKYPPTLIFTSATASVKASANFVAFASAKFGLRALSQSLAKEFGPQGVHISHVVADGVFDTERSRSYAGSTQGLMDTDEMAESYWKLHTQGKKAWTWEIDLRPYLEKW